MLWFIWWDIPQVLFLIPILFILPYILFFTSSILPYILFSSLHPPSSFCSFATLATYHPPPPSHIYPYIHPLTSISFSFLLISFSFLCYLSCYLSPSLIPRMVAQFRSNILYPPPAAGGWLGPVPHERSLNTADHQVPRSGRALPFLFVFFLFFLAWGAWADMGVWASCYYCCSLFISCLSCLDLFCSC